MIFFRKKFQSAERDIQRRARCFSRCEWCFVQRTI